MPRLSTESWGAGDQSWLGSAHAIWNCRTVTLDISAFNEATHYPDGYIPSGTPLSESDGMAVPYESGGVLAGFLFTDQTVVGDYDIPAPLLDHGRVKVDRLPVGFVAPDGASNATTIVFLAGEGS